MYTRSAQLVPILSVLKAARRAVIPATSLLSCLSLHGADICKKYTSPMTGKPVALVAAGEISDGRSLVTASIPGAGAVRISTRFVTAEESSASSFAKKSITEAGFDSVIKSLVWSGRPLRALSNPYIADREQNRQAEIKFLTGCGIVPLQYDLDRLHSQGKLTEEIEDQAMVRYTICSHPIVSALLTFRRPMGVVAGLVNREGQSAKEIVDEIVEEATRLLGSANKYVTAQTKL
jgi:NAD(P)H-dependent flavin oxidoreductase YrpB (nitropropane dioxygenase family)